MTFTKLTMQPGVNVQASKFASIGEWVECNFVRFFQGLLQKLGGWQKFADTPVIGSARGIHAWADLQGNPYVIVGTDQRVMIWDGGQIEDVTPLRTTTNVTPAFTTTNGSTTVNVKDVANGSEAGDWIYLPVPVSVGGIILYGYYQIDSLVDSDNYHIIAADTATANVTNGGAVPRFSSTNLSPTVNVLLNNHGLTTGSIFLVNVSTTVANLTINGSYAVTFVDANNFTINAGINANATTNVFENGGNVRIQYLISTGSSSPLTLSGYGGGDYGGGDYGLDNGQAVSVQPLRQWFFDTWGEDAIGNPTNGTLYVWIPPYSVNPRMTPVAGAPTMMTSSFVSMPQQIAVALGAETGGIQDPNLVRWCDVADYNDWTASSLNQAGSFRISSGSRIVSGTQGPTQGYIWTDVDLWAMQYIQPPFIFGFTRIGQSCGLACARGWAILGNVVYWLGYKQFYVFDGSGVKSIPCNVWDIIFNNIDTTNIDKAFAAPNSLFNEIAWYFPSVNGGGEIDSYVKLNTDNGQWDYSLGTITRTCWEDQSVVGPPIGVDGNGYIQQHETSNDADGTPMVSYAVSNFQDMGSGEGVAFSDLILPDFTDRTSGTTVELVVMCAKNTASAIVTKGPYQVTSQTQYITTRNRGRFIAMKVGSSDLGSFWRLGEIRLRISQDGTWI